MKKQLLSIAILSTAFVTLAHAQTTQELAKRVTDFKTMELAHKGKWFDLETDMHKAKMDLVKKHMMEQIDLAKRKIMELAKTKDVDAYLQSKLADMIALHKQQMQEWKTFMQTWFDKKQAQGEKEAGELAKFEGVEESAEESEE
jgi:hypothetical protein